MNAGLQKHHVWIQLKEKQNALVWPVQVDAALFADALTVTISLAPVTQNRTTEKSKGEEERQPRHIRERKGVSS